MLDSRVETGIQFGSQLVGFLSTGRSQSTMSYVVSQIDGYLGMYINCIMTIHVYTCNILYSDSAVTNYY